MDNFINNIGLIQYLRDSVGATVDSVKAVADSWNITPILFFIVGAIVALTVALFGYRIIKFVCGVGLATMGYTVGNALFAYLVNTFSLDFLPNFLTYVCGALIAVLFFFLGYKKFNYVLFAAAYLMSVNLMMALIGDITLAMGAALVIALICVFIIRIVSVLFTSFAGSCLAVAFIGEILTGVSFLQLATSGIAVIIALSAGVVFAVIQFIFSRYYYAK